MAKKPVEEATAPEAEEAVEDIGLGNETAAPMVEEDPGVPLVEEAPAEFIETPTLTAAEIASIRKQARKAVEAEFKIKMRKDALEAEKEKAREQLSMNNNAHLNGVLSDLVKITIDIPEFSNTPWIQFDLPHGPAYIHGRTYTVKRHIGNSLREIMQNMRRHQNEIDGKKRNRQLPSGAFIDATTGAVSRGLQVGGA